MVLSLPGIFLHSLIAALLVLGCFSCKPTGMNATQAAQQSNASGQTGEGAGSTTTPSSQDDPQTANVRVSSLDVENSAEDKTPSLSLTGDQQQQAAPAVGEVSLDCSAAKEKLQKVAAERNGPDANTENEAEKVEKNSSEAQKIRDLGFVMPHSAIADALTLCKSVTVTKSP